MGQRIVILGGGISGLSMAYFLQQKGKDVVLLEKNEQAGGVIQTEIDQGFVCESGPNTVLINNPAIAQLLTDLKLIDQCVFADKSSSKRFLLHNNQLMALPGTAGQFFRSPLLTPLQKMRVLMEPFVSQHGSKENPSIKAFVCRRFGSSVYEKFVVPFVTGIYAGDPAHMSVRHALRMLYTAEQQYGSVLLGLPKHIKKRNAQLNQMGVPAGALFSFRNGMQHLTSTLHKELANVVKCNAEAYRLEVADNKVHLHYRQHGKEEHLVADQLVSTLDAPATAQLLSPLDSDLGKRLNKVDYAPMAILHLGFRKSSLKNAVRGFGVLTTASEQHHFLGSIFSSVMFPHTAPKDMELFTVFAGGQRQPDIVQLPDEAFKQLVIPEIQTLLGSTTAPEFVRIKRWQSAIPQYSLDHQSLLDATAQFQATHQRIHLGGNYLHGVSLSDCIANASYLATKLANH
jgi:oxygen-dependent protoporphyrinogen oxidase